MTIGISSFFSSLKDNASSTSSSLKTIRSTPFSKIYSLYNALHFWPFFFLEARRLKLFVNYFVNSSIMFKCLHLDKVVLLSSFSLMCLFTSLFWRLCHEVNNFSVLVSFNIFLEVFFLLCFLLIISTTYNESILQKKLYWFYLFFLNNGICCLWEILNYHDPNLGLATNVKGMERWRLRM